MNEEIEYAEMLEIPVSTVNVIQKPRKKRRSNAKPRAERTQPVAPEKPDLKDSLIAQVNDKVSPETAERSEEPFALLEEPQENLVNYDDPVPASNPLDSDYADRIDTVRLLSVASKKKRRNARQALNENGEQPQNEAPVYEPKRRSRAASIVLGTEFALACALSATIFLTHVFMPNSGINTFFKGLNSPEKQTGDARTYEDFTLSSVTSALSDTQLTLSDTGVLSFTDECMVYPVADGKIADVQAAEDGSYIVKISHSDSFTGVVEGLNQVYYSVGETVKANVPMGFSKGEREVQVTMYSAGELLNCFEMTEEGCLAWVEKE